MGLQTQFLVTWLGNYYNLVYDNDVYKSQYSPNTKSVDIRRKLDESRSCKLAMFGLRHYVSM